mgnify:CR=1 FL=1
MVTRNAIVTGAARGIGRAIIEALLDRGWQVAALDLLIVPLSAFDAAARRIGMGGGFYDRTFAFSRIRPCMAPKLVGLAHDFQRVEQLPIEPWDVPLHGVVTDKRCYRFRP